jgi:DNA-3-methyladenine glycosylase I
MSDDELERILLDPGIIRNRLKVYSVRKNANRALQIQKEFGSLSLYFRRFGVFPLVNHPKSLSDIQTETEVSKAISKDLKKRGMSFIGSTIIYAFMQAVGMVDDHIEGCFVKSL